jgi:hypothetical protein
MTAKNYSNICNILSKASQAPTGVARLSLLKTANALLQHELAVARVDAKKEG